MPFRDAREVVTQTKLMMGPAQPPRRQAYRQGTCPLFRCRTFAYHAARAALHATLGTEPASYWSSQPQKSMRDTRRWRPKYPRTKTHHRRELAVGGHWRFLQPDDLVPAVLRGNKSEPGVFTVLKHLGGALVVKCERDTTLDVRRPHHPHPGQ